MSFLNPLPAKYTRTEQLNVYFPTTTGARAWIEEKREMVATGVSCFTTLPPGDRGGLRSVIVALPGKFRLLFSSFDVLSETARELFD